MTSPDPSVTPLVRPDAPDIDGNGADPPTFESPATGGTAWIDRLPGPVGTILTVAGFAVPVGLFVGSAVTQSVNVVMADNLSTMAFLDAARTRTVPWDALWAQYNQDRSFFPNLVTLALARADHLDMRVEDVIGALMVVAGTALMIWAHKRWARSCPWLYYCPVAFVTLSLVQFGNTFLGGVSWYLTFLALGAVLALLDTVRPGPVALTGAILAALVGSYSSFAGLLIWPAGLALLWLRGRSWSSVAVWAASGVLSVALYFRNFSFNASAHPSPGYLGGHPGQAVQVFLTAVGDGLGATVGQGSSSGWLVMSMGALVLVVATVAVVVAVRSRGSGGGGPVGVAMICFGVLFALSVTVGRAGFGASGASASRYTTFDVLILAGAYLGLLDQRPGAVRADDAGRPAARPPGAPSRRRTVGVVALAAALVLVGIQAVVGTVNGAQGERAYHRQQETAAVYLRDYRYVPDYALTTAVDPWRTAAWIRSRASIAQAQHLSAFSVPTSRTADVPRLPPPTPVVLLPRAGSTARGTIALDAGTTRTIGVRSVTFVIRSADGVVRARAASRFGPYGWAVLWDARGVPDGAYTIVATAMNYTGRTATGAAVPFEVVHAGGSTQTGGGGAAR